MTPVAKKNLSTGITLGNFEKTFASDIRRGLTAADKSIPCIYFYDRKGSELFEEICRLQEYYLTHAESEILEKSADDIAGIFPANISLIELGSGSSIKTQYLIKAFLARNGNLDYIPIDVSENILKESAAKLSHKYPGLTVNPVTARYKEGIDLIEHRQHNPKLILWLGSSIGNTDREGAVRFLRHICDRIPLQDRLLIGIDLLKDRSILERAYNDSAGITAQFNLNLLSRINRELGGDFRPAGFSHLALFNEKKGCIELFLRSTVRQKVKISTLGLEVIFSEGELIHTEDSYKYSLADIETLAKNSDLILENQWFDSKKWFSLNLFALKG